MYYSVKSVEPGSDYTLIITFENGERKQFDMKPYLDIGNFRELKDVNLFNTAHVSFNTVSWENDADFDPEALYDKGLPV